MYGPLITMNNNGRTLSGYGTMRFPVPMGAYGPSNTNLQQGNNPQLTSDTPDFAVDPETGAWWSPSAMAAAATSTPAVPTWLYVVGGIAALLFLSRVK